MKRQYLTISDIDRVCIRLRNSISYNYPQYKSYMHFIYYYGCRIGELFDFRISYNAESMKVQIIPQKKNNTRYLDVVHSDTQKWIEDINITQNLFHLNKRNLQRIIEKENSIRGLRCGNKNIGAHIFRHNWIKKQVANGKQITTIDILLGYTNQTVASTYAISKIYY